jgi:hypothetical protein
MTFDDFLPYVEPSVNACPTSVALHHIRQAAIEFCEKAQVWRERMDTLIADGISSRYAMPVDDQTEISRLLEVVVGSPDGVPERYDIVSPLDGQDEQRIQSAARIAWTDNRHDLFLHPVPKSGDQIEVYVSLKPSQAAFSFPDYLFHHHADHIAAGALSRLFRMPKTDWYDPAMAVERQAVFQSAINVQGLTAAKGNGRSMRRHTTRWF